MKTLKITRKPNRYRGGRDWFYGDTKIGESLTARRDSGYDQGKRGLHFFIPEDAFYDIKMKAHILVNMSLQDIQNALDKSARKGWFSECEKKA